MTTETTQQTQQQTTTSSDASASAVQPATTQETPATLLDGSTEQTQPSETDEKGQADAAGEGEKGKDGEGDTEEKTVDPASYEIKVPEGMKLDEVLSNDFREFAAKNKFSQEQVAELTGLYVKAQQQQADMFEQTIAGWSKSVSEDKELGGTNWQTSKVAGNKAVSFLFGEDFIKEYLVGWGLGTNPGFVRGMVKLGKLINEGSFDGKGGGAPSKPRTAEEAIYGTTGNFNPAKK